jgi:hypothetical protein
MINILLLIGWIGCGVLAVGLLLAHSKFTWPTIWQDDYESRWILCCFFVPLGLFSLVAVFFTCGMGKHGLRYRKFSRQDKLEAVENELDGTVR